MFKIIYGLNKESIFYIEISLIIKSVILFLLIAFIKIFLRFSKNHQVKILLKLNQCAVLHIFINFLCKNLFIKISFFIKCKIHEELTLTEPITIIKAKVNAITISKCSANKNFFAVSNLKQNIKVTDKFESQYKNKYLFKFGCRLIS